MRAATTALGAFAALAGADSLEAHHSSSMFDVSSSIWVKGTVVRYEPINPHSMIMLDVKNDAGQVEHWTVEGPRLGRLDQLGVDENFLTAGDVIEVCGFFYKEDVAAQGPFSKNHVHGRVLVLSDGEKWLWGPYGNLENCLGKDQWASIHRGTTRRRDDEIP